MDVVALIAWLVTAAGGVTMLGIWLGRGGARSDATRLPAPVVFGHAALAVAGLILWIIYMAADSNGFAWAAFVILVVVALLGLSLFSRWIPARRASSVLPGGEPPERHFPTAVVAAHGLLGVATLVLVFLAAAGVGD
jgi:manganese efflux pump family protein